MPVGDYQFGSVIYHNGGTADIADDLAELNIRRVTDGATERLQVFFYGVPLFYTSGAKFMREDEPQPVPARETRAFRSRWGAHPGWGRDWTWSFTPFAVVSYSGFPGWTAIAAGPTTVLG